MGIDKQTGVTHSDVIRNCNGTLKLGIVFDGFNRPGEKFDFPFGLGVEPQFNSASLRRMMQTDKVTDNILDYPDVSTHFRSTDLLTYLDQFTDKIPNLKVIRNTVTLEELENTYDLLIDCTGLNSKFSYQPDNYVDISDKIPNNAAFVFRLPYTDKEKQLKPYSMFKAMEAGWVWHIPLGDQLAMGYVHCDKFDVRNEFVEYIKSYTGVDVDPSQLRKVPFVTGRCKRHLTGNVVRIGLASGFVEPLESTGIYLITASLEKIKQYIDGELEEDEYNNRVNQEFDDIINFIVAHYKYSKRDNEYWNYYKDIPVEKYKPTDLFPIEAWDYILSGFDENISTPLEQIDPRELIRIHRGIPYAEWLENEKNAG